MIISELIFDIMFLAQALNTIKNDEYNIAPNFSSSRLKYKKTETICKGDTLFQDCYYSGLLSGLRMSFCVVALPKKELFFLVLCVYCL